MSKLYCNICASNFKDFTIRILWYGQYVMCSDAMFVTH